MRCALVADDDATYGMARMFATLSDRDGVEVVVFRNAGETTCWLDAGDAVEDR